MRVCVCVTFMISSLYLHLILMQSQKSLSVSSLSVVSQQSLSSLSAVYQQSISSLSAVSQQFFGSLLAVFQFSLSSFLALSFKSLVLSFLIHFIIFSEHTSSNQRSTKYFVFFFLKPSLNTIDRFIYVVHAHGLVEKGTKLFYILTILICSTFIM